MRTVQYVTCYSQLIVTARRVLYQHKFPRWRNLSCLNKPSQEMQSMRPVKVDYGYLMEHFEAKVQPHSKHPQLSDHMFPEPSFYLQSPQHQNSIAKKFPNLLK